MPGGFAFGGPPFSAMHLGNHAVDDSGLRLERI
jgi:hypothetical protein